MRFDAVTLQAVLRSEERETPAKLQKIITEQFVASGERDRDFTSGKQYGSVQKSPPYLAKSAS